MRLIGKAILTVIIIFMITSCFGGSIAFKKNSKYTNEDICNPWFGKNDRYNKYKDFSYFINREANIETRIDVTWTSWNYWYFLVIVIPIPTYGLLRENKTAILKITTSNNSSEAVTLMSCDIQFFALKKESSNYTQGKSLRNCSNGNFLIVEPGATNMFQIEYSEEDFEEINQVLLKFSEKKSHRVYEQIIELTGDWEFCTQPLNG